MFNFMDFDGDNKVSKEDLLATEVSIPVTSCNMSGIIRREGG